MGFSNDISGTTQFANIRSGRFVQIEADDKKTYFNTFSGNLEGLRLREREYEGDHFTDLELKFWDGSQRTVISGTAFRDGKIQLWAWMLIDRLTALPVSTPDRVTEPIEITIKVWPNDFLTDSGETRVATSCLLEHKGVQIKPLHDASATPMDQRVLLAVEAVTRLQLYFPSFGKATDESAPDTPEPTVVPTESDDLPF